MATSSSRAMKSSLVVVLLLGAVVASQAHQVSCKNACEKAMFLNGIWTDVGETTVLEVKNVIKAEVDEGEGVKHVVQFKCPEDVQALEFVYHGGGFVKAQIPDVSARTTLHSGRRTLRESDRLGGKSDLVSKHRSLRAGGGVFSNIGAIVGGSLGTVRGGPGVVGGVAGAARSTVDGAVGDVNVVHVRPPRNVNGVVEGAIGDGR